MTEYLSPEQVLFIHSRLISESGGEFGIRELGLLLSAVGRPQATFEGKDLYPDIIRKTAALFDSLVRNHPFLDGNKRTAMTASALFLRMNGYRINVSNEEMVEFTLACAQSQLTLNEIVVWFKQFSNKEV